MCGITGYYDPSGVYVNSSKNIVSAMSLAIKHRGPDNMGFWLSEDKRLALAHQRLSIIDLSIEGNQPMTSPSGRYVIIFNGEIYNHQEIKSLLNNNNWRGSSDTEILLAAIEAWGISETIEKCNGMFAIILWDRDLNQLTMIRDRLGEKPLYYGWNKNVLLFASELKSFKHHPAFNGEMDSDAIGLYFQYGYIPGTKSIYKSINKILPGTMVQFNLDTTEKVSEEVTEYWTLKNSTYSHQLVENIYENRDPVDDLEELLLQVISQQSIADVQLGSFLSGGVDSSLITALLQKQTNTRVKTFSIGFSEKKYDESAYASKVAEHLNTDHNELILNSEDLKNVIPNLPELFDEPFSDPSAVPTLLVSKFAKTGVTVCLSGDGGDELFGGYSRYHRTHNIWSKISRIPNEIRDSFSLMMQPIDALYKERDLFHKWQRLSSYLKCDSLLDCYKLQTQNSQTELKKILNLDFNIFNNETNKPFKNYEEMMYLDAITYLPGDILVKVDRSAMSVSLETRAPFLNHDVVEFAFNLPEKYKINKRDSKIILNQLLSRYVPIELFKRPKMGFGMPIDIWMRDDLREWTEDTLSTSNIKKIGIFNEKLVRKRLNEHLSGKSDWHIFLWRVLMFIEWHQKH